MVYQKLCCVDIALYPVWHQDTDHTLCSQSFCTESSYDRAILSSGDSDHCVTVRTVLFEKFPDPQNTFLFCLWCVKHVFPFDQIFFVNRKRASLSCFTQRRPCLYTADYILWYFPMSIDKSFAANGKTDGIFSYLSASFESP